MQCPNWTLLLLILASFLSTITLADEDHHRLFSSLLSNYDKDIRPSTTKPVVVEFVFSLQHILDVDEKNQIATTNAWINQRWHDSMLVWDPRHFNDITTLHVPSWQIWVPDIVLYNNADFDYTKALMSTDAILSYDGNVSWTMAGVFKSSCALDVRYYPFDRQNCILTFASWAFDGTKIDLFLPPETEDHSNNYKDESTEWVLHRIWTEKKSIIYSCCVEPYPFVNVHVLIQRRPLFFVFNLILPCVLISFVALLAFVLPSFAGEKVTLGITAFLSTAIFLMAVAEEMPPTSETLPLIGIYYGATILNVAVQAGMSVLTLNINHHGDKGQEMSPRLQRFAFVYATRIMLMKIEPYHSINYHVEYCFGRSPERREHTSGRRQPPQMTRRTSPPIVTSRRPSSSTLPERAFSAKEPNNNHRPPSRQHKEVKRGLLSLSVSSVKKRVSFSDDSMTSSLPLTHNGSLFGRRATTQWPNAAALKPPLPPPHQLPAPINYRSRETVSAPPPPQHHPPLPSPNSIFTISRSSKVSFSSDDEPSSFITPAAAAAAAAAAHRRQSTFSATSPPPSSDSFEDEFMKVLSKLHDTIERNEMRLGEKDRRNAMRLEWRQVALVLDRFFLLLFVVVTVLSSLIILFQKEIFSLE